MRCFFRYVVFIGFTFLFFSLFLFLPSNEVSEQENRKLVSVPVLFKNSAFNLNFGSDLDAYLKDHFPYRENLISDYFKILYAINTRLENKYVIGGKEGWLYRKSDIFRTTDFKEGELEQLSEKLNKLNQIFKKNGITFIVLAVPSKIHVYFEYLNPFIDIQKINDKTLILQEYIQKHNTDILFLYPLNALLKQKNDFPTPLYQKGDHHPSGWGYFVLYQELMKMIQKDFSHIVIYSRDDFTFDKVQFGLGSERRELGFTDPVLEYSKIIFKKNYAIKTERKGEHAYWKNIYEPGQCNVFFLGSSIGMEIHKMMFPSFKKTIFMRDNAEKQPDSNEDIFPDLFHILLEEKIDIFILEMPEDRILSHRFSERLDDILNSYEK